MGFGNGPVGEKLIEKGFLPEKKLVILEEPFGFPEHRHLSLRDEAPQAGVPAPFVLLKSFLVRKLHGGQMVIVDFLFGEGALVEGEGAAEVIMIQVVAVNEVVIVAHEADFPEHRDLRPELLPELAADRVLEVLAGLYAASRGLDQDGAAEIVVPLCVYEIERTSFVHDDRADDLPVMVGIFVRPFLVGEREVQHVYSVFGSALK